MSICAKDYALHIAAAPPPCGAGTDWSNPGNCRLRIQSFSPADWVGLSCGTPSGDPVWDGTFPVWVAGQTYNAVAGRSLDGKGLSNTTLVTFSAGLWRCSIISFIGPGGFTFQGQHVGATPLGLYASTGVADCVFVAKTLVIEAYSL